MLTITEGYSSFKSGGGEGPENNLKSGSTGVSKILKALQEGVKKI